MKVLIFLFIFSSFLISSDVLKICGNPNYPPFHWENNNKIIGVGPEVISIIMKELNIVVDNNFSGNWARCQADIKTGRKDMFTAGYKNKDRKKYAIYTTHFLKEDPQVILVKKGKKFKFKEWADLIGKKGGHILGSSLGSNLDLFLEQNVDMFYVSSRLQIFQMLDLERIDFEIVGLWPAKVQMNRFNFTNKLVPLDKVISTEYLFMAMSKKSIFIKYMPYISLRLKQMNESGLIDKIINKHLSTY